MSFQESRMSSQGTTKSKSSQGTTMSKSSQGTTRTSQETSGSITSTSSNGTPRHLKDAQGYYIDDGVYSDKSSESKEEKRRSLTKDVYPPWYRRYGYTLPETERIYAQPRVEFQDTKPTRKSIMRREFKRSSASIQKKAAEDAKKLIQKSSALKIERVLNWMDAPRTKNSSINLKIASSNDHIDAINALKVVTSSTPEVHGRSLSVGGQKQSRKESCWKRVSINPIIKAKISTIAKKQRSAEVARKWKNAFRTVAAVYRFGQILADIAQTTAAVFKAFNEMMDDNILHNKAEGQYGRFFDRTKYKAPNIAIGIETINTLRVVEDMRTEVALNKAIQALRRTRCFSAFPTSFQLQMVKIGQFLEVPRDRVIIREGQMPQCFYFLLSGKAVAMRLVGSPEITKAGRFEVVRRLGTDSMFGEEGVFQKEYRPYSVSSRAKCQLLSIAIDDFYRMTLTTEIDENPEHLLFISQLEFMKYFPIEVLVNKAGDGNVVHFYFADGKIVTDDVYKSNYIFVVKTGSCKVLQQTSAFDTTKASSTLTVWRPPEPEFNLDKELDMDFTGSYHDSDHERRTSAQSENTAAKGISFAQLPDINIQSPSRPVSRTVSRLEARKQSFETAVKRCMATEDYSDPKIRRMSYLRLSADPTPQISPGRSPRQSLQGDSRRESMSKNRDTLGGSRKKQDSYLCSQSDIPFVKASRTQVTMQESWEEIDVQETYLTAQQLAEMHSVDSRLSNMSTIQMASCWEKMITVPSRSKAMKQSIWIHLKELRESDSIGLETMDFGDPRIYKKLAVISKGCIVVGIKKEFIRNNADHRMTAQLRAASLIFADTHQLHFELTRLKYWRRFAEKTRRELK